METDRWPAETKTITGKWDTMSYKLNVAGLTLTFAESNKTLKR
jgi:hypothetical protein